MAKDESTEGAARPASLRELLRFRMELIRVSAGLTIGEALALLEVADAARDADESRAAIQKLDAEGYKLPTPEWERLQEVACSHSKRMDRMRETLNALNALLRGAA